ncbi:MAG: hypothetical protein R2698_09835 [Microthrixaceae bacterium]
MTLDAGSSPARRWAGRLLVAGAVVAVIAYLRERAFAKNRS